jgi:hypothetical protein
MSEPRTPSAHERRLLEKNGYQEKAAGYFSNGGEPVTTDEALDKILADKPSRPHRRGLNTTEFWMIAGVVIPAMAAGVQAMSVPSQSLPAPYNVVAGLALTGLSAALAAGYAVLRSAAKRQPP